MKLKKSSASSIVAMLGGLAGCVSQPPEEPVIDDELTSSTEHELTLWRNDVNGSIRPGEGQWGGWQQLVFCNEGTWAVGYQMRVEPYQGGGLSGDNDDTSLNAVRLLCKDPITGGTEWVSSHDGLWGSWGSQATCSGAGSYVRSARIRIESSQGGDDDTAANDVELACTRSLGTIHASGGNSWGSWSYWAQCPTNTAVCGIQSKFEGSQGGGDDTAMNAFEMRCCNLPCNNDGVCNGKETSYTCASDCGAPPPVCGDGTCNGTESSYTCSSDCGPPPTYCGDGVCNGSETSYSCPGDCGGGTCLIDPCAPQCINSNPNPSYICPLTQAE